MELNYSLKTADEALAIIAPETNKFIKAVLTSRGGVEDKNSVLAITRLCELLKFHNKNLVKSRNRKLTKAMCECLLRLKKCGSAEVHRSKFMTLPVNDFSIMQYWGFIEKGLKRGYWRITERGRAFVLAIPGFAWTNLEVTQIGGNKGNYALDKKSKVVTFSDILNERV